MQAIFNRLEELGQLKEQESQQLYSEAAGKFLADRLVSGTCPKCAYEVRPHILSRSVAAPMQAIALDDGKKEAYCVPPH